MCMPHFHFYILSHISRTISHLPLCLPPPTRCDGTVAIFDVKSRQASPSMESDASTGRHTDPVWKVRVGGFTLCNAGNAP